LSGHFLQDGWGFLEQLTLFISVEVARTSHSSHKSTLQSTPKELKLTAFFSTV